MKKIYVALNLIYPDFELQLDIHDSGVFDRFSYRFSEAVDPNLTIQTFVITPTNSAGDSLSFPIEAHRFDSTLCFSITRWGYDMESQITVLYNNRVISRNVKIHGGYFISIPTLESNLINVEMKDTRTAIIVTSLPILISLDRLIRVHNPNLNYDIKLTMDSRPLKFKII